MIELGSKVRDIVTGFTGIVTSRAEHLTTCRRYWVQPEADKDGKTPDGQWVDEPTLMVVKEPSKEIREMKRALQTPAPAGPGPG